MEPGIGAALERGGIADITTIGRKSGLSRRIEIVFHQFDGDYYLTGRPGRKRDWEANIEANPSFTLHLKGDTLADIEVLGEAVADPTEKAKVIRRALVETWGSPPERVDARLQEWVDSSPLIRFRTT